MPESNSFSTELRRWYGKHQRDLPWRHTSDPYKIWLSEIILQQTRVAQGMPYYEKFVEHYPTINDLASASEEKVLRDWQGLGYYSRARNLHATAKKVAFEMGGKFPDSYAEIVKLKGIGPYTAAAIASFAFNEKVAPVDGNVIRVLSRYFGITDDTSEGKTLKSIDRLANEILPAKEHSMHNQAMMEFGALQCVPSSPDCSVCPMKLGCYALNNESVSDLPIKSKKIKKRNRYFYYLVIKYKGQLFMQKRGPKDVWTNLYEFFLIEKPSHVETDEILSDAEEKLGKNTFKFQTEKAVKKHVLSHQNIYTVFLEIELFKELDLSNLNLKPYSIERVRQLPKPILINNYLDTNIFS